VLPAASRATAVSGVCHRRRSAVPGQGIGLAVGPRTERRTVQLTALRPRRVADALADTVHRPSKMTSMQPGRGHDRSASAYPHCSTCDDGPRCRLFPALRRVRLRERVRPSATVRCPRNGIGSGGISARPSEHGQLERHYDHATLSTHSPTTVTTRPNTAAAGRRGHRHPSADVVSDCHRDVNGLDVVGSRLRRRRTAVSCVRCRRDGSACPGNRVGSIAAFLGNECGTVRLKLQLRQPTVSAQSPTP